MQLMSAYLSGDPNNGTKVSLPPEYLGEAKELVLHNLVRLAHRALAAKTGDVLKAASKASDKKPAKLKLKEQTGTPFLTHAEMDAKLQLFGEDATTNETKAYLVREILEYVASKKARSVVARAYVKNVNKAIPREQVSKAIASIIVS